MVHPRFGEVMLNIEKRQSAVPTCVTTCMAQGEIAPCKSATDYACLCASPPYLDSVTACWQSTCNAEEITYGQQYATKACAAFGVNLNSTTPTVPTNNDNSTSTSNNTADSTPSIDLYGNPVLYQKAFVNVQAIMSSVCALLFAIAIILGVLACRKKIKVDREAAQRSTWTGVGGSTFNAIETKGGTNGSRFGMSRNATGTGSRTVGLDSNFDITSMGTLGYNQRSSYGMMGGVSINRDPNASRLNRSGFTNRLTLGDMGEGASSGDWEISPKSSPGKETQPLAESPTGSTSSIGRLGESTVDLGGGDDDEKSGGVESSLELNTVPVLQSPAEAHTRGRAI